MKRTGGQHFRGHGPINQAQFIVANRGLHTDLILANCYYTGASPEVPNNPTPREAVGRSAPAGCRDFVKQAEVRYLSPERRKLVPARAEAPW